MIVTAVALALFFAFEVFYQRRERARVRRRYYGNTATNSRYPIPK